MNLGLRQYLRTGFAQDGFQVRLLVEDSLYGSVQVRGQRRAADQ